MSSRAGEHPHPSGAAARQAAPQRPANTHNAHRRKLATVAPALATRGRQSPQRPAPLQSGRARPGHARSVRNSPLDSSWPASSPAPDYLTAWKISPRETAPRLNSFSFFFIEQTPPLETNRGNFGHILCVNPSVTHLCSFFIQFRAEVISFQFFTAHTKYAAARETIPNIIALTNKPLKNGHYKLFWLFPDT